MGRPRLAERPGQPAGEALSGPVEINIAGKNEIRKINRQYRGINKATDVLAFAWREERKIKGEILGQVYICYPKIKEQAKEYEVIAEEEFARILAHGLLHLVGYDHYIEKKARIMFDIQEKTVRDYFMLIT